MKIDYSNEFKKQLKLMLKRGEKIDLLNKVVDMLVSGEKLPKKYNDHELHGEFKGYRDCHIKPDWVLIYSIEPNLLYLYKTGTHSDLF